MTARFPDAGRIVAFAALMVFVSMAAIVSSASAATAGPGWEITAHVYPTNVEPEGRGTLEIDPFNVGAAATVAGRAITVTDVLPPGVVATNAGDLRNIADGVEGSGQGFEPTIGHELWICTGNGPGPEPAVDGASVVTCTINREAVPVIEGGGGLPSRGLGPNFEPEIAIAVQALPGAKEIEINDVTIAGGGAPTPASTRNTIRINATPAGFGFQDSDAWFSNADGTIDTQTGSHPYEATFDFDLATVLDKSKAFLNNAGGEPRNIVFDFPPGLIGDPTAVPQCTAAQFDAEECPNASQVGIITVRTSEYPQQFSFRVFDLAPTPSLPAEFGFPFEGINTYLESSVRSGSDYSLATHVNNIPQKDVIGSTLMLWGVPGDASHDRWRDSKPGGCTQEQIEQKRVCGTSPGGLGKPFLTLPTSCAGPQTFSIESHPWGDPGVTSRMLFSSHDANDNPLGYTGCEHLGFGPAVSTEPDTAKTDTPTGLTVDVKPLIGGLQDPEGVGTSDIQNTTVTLPEGFVINPGQAAGLKACGPGEDALTTASETAEGSENSAPAKCPNASKVGTVKIKTPLIEDAAEKEFEGSVYVMQSNPPDLKLLVAASADGVNLKLVGNVHLDANTGRLTTKFEGTPELPFTDFRLSFSGGAQAALDSPTRCGTYTTTADFEPWASPFISDFLTNATFDVTEGSGGASCPSSPLPFGPSLTAGSTTDQAGGFTDFSLLLQSADDQQRIERLQFKVPQGLLGMISQVPLCGEPQASAGTCSSASQIGHTTVASGPGPYPLVVPQPGQPPAAIYLTGPYDGAPYGLSIVVPVVVGPFTLQTQIVRAKIEVDSLTAQITVTTDPLPQVIDGVPTDLRTVDAVIDRRGFMFNPTNCAPMSFSGTAWGTPPPGVGGPGSPATISSPFQMGSCRSLLFKPNFKVSTAGKTSRRNGASLNVKLTYPTGNLGANQASSQANIAQVKVDLPKQLPSRLTTLQKACPAKIFEANPAGCPAASKVGSVVAHTPVLPVPLTGPAIFVSYGGAKFPELVFVLQGYGVTVYVHAETFINEHTNVTSSTIRRVPDVPIQSFELKLPQGPNSALAATGNLCTSKPKMPTAFTGQNGAVIHQSTPINVTGCPKKGKKRHR